LSGYVSSVIKLLGKSGASGNPYALVAPGALFTTSADIIGSANAIFNVSGSFSFSGGRVSANITVTASGTFNIQGTGLNAGSLSVSANAKVVLDLSAPGTNTFFSSVASCVSGAVITRKVTGSFAANTVAATGTVFSYNSTGSVEAHAPGCSIVLEDSLGVTATLNTAGATSQDHSHIFAALPPSRIFATDSGNANWGGKSLTYNLGSSSAATTQATPFIFVFGAILLALFSY